MKIRVARKSVDPITNSPKRDIQRRNQERREREMADNANNEVDELRQEIVIIRVRVSEQEWTANTPLPPPLVNTYATPNAKEADEWRTTVAANNFMLHPPIISMVQANQFSERPKVELKYVHRHMWYHKGEQCEQWLHQTEDVWVFTTQSDKILVQWIG